jgi:MSHA pilin protein MshA
MKNQNGFTLIELVVVIVVLGILSAIAVPKFISMKQEAGEAALQGVAGSLASASAINYAKASIDKSNAAVTEVLNCTATASLLQGDALPTGYSIGTAAITDDEAVTCTLTSTLITTNNTATFTAIGVNVPAAP